MRKKVKAKKSTNSTPDKSGDKTSKSNSSMTQAKRKVKVLILWAVIIGLCIIIIWGYILLMVFPIEEMREIEAQIDFSTEFIDDNTMELGEQKTEREGEPGKEKNIWKVKKKGLLTQTEVSSAYDHTERLEEPVNKIVRRGTRKWQYMICSDGSYRYYDDEQFANPDTGFTHASEDFCAKNGQGTMVSLADQPPVRQNNTSNSYSTYRPYTYTPSYTPSYSTSSPDLTTLQPDYNNNTNSIETSTDRTTANNICQSEANTTYQSILRQLGAMGAGGSAQSQAQQARNTAYNNCMSRYGF